MPRRALRTGLAALLAGLLALALLGCGEPAVALDIPARPAGAHLLDAAGVLDPRIDAQLRELSHASGYDVVGLAFEDPRPNRGQADRGGRLLLEEWGADIVLVVVGGPGDLTSTEADRSRFFGVYADDRFTVSRDLRERILYDRVQLPAADNEWDAAFSEAIEELEAELVHAAEG